MKFPALTGGRQEDRPHCQIGMKREYFFIPPPAAGEHDAQGLADRLSKQARVLRIDDSNGVSPRTASPVMTPSTFASP